MSAESAHLSTFGAETETEAEIRRPLYSGSTNGGASKGHHPAAPSVGEIQGRNWVPSLLEV